MDLGGLADKLQQMAGRVGALDLRQPLAVAAQLMVSESKQTFVQQKDVSGNPWPPLKNPRRLRGGLVQLDARPLRNTGRLMASITGSVQGNTASAGTNVFYAGYQQFGTRYMVARRFLGISAKTRSRIEGLVRQAVLKQLRGGK